MTILRWGKALSAAPVVQAVGYDDAKAFLRLPDDTEASIISSLLTAAEAKVQEDTGRLLTTQTWDLTLDAFPYGCEIEMPFAPLLSVTSVTTTNVAGVSSVFSATNYRVDIASFAPRIVLADSASWPSDLRMAQAVVIRAVFGYGATTASVPEPLRLAILQLVAQWYAVRTAAGAPIPPPWMGYSALIAPYRFSWGIA